jgi:hypothetical protein
MVKTMAKYRNMKIGNEVRAAAPVAKVTTPVRNTPIPKVAAPVKREITHEMIARRAYEISQSPQASDETSNWLRAERELRGV